MQVHPLPLSFLVHFSELANHDLCFSIYLIIQKDTRITSLQVSVLLKSAGNAKEKKRKQSEPRGELRTKITWHDMHMQKLKT